MGIFYKVYCVCNNCVKMSDAIPIKEEIIGRGDYEILEKLGFYNVRISGDDHEGEFETLCKKCAAEFNDRGRHVEFISAQDRIAFNKGVEITNAS